MSPEVRTALWIGAGLSAVLGGVLIQKALQPVVTPPEPPRPIFGQEQPEILQAVAPGAPYGIQPVSQQV